LEFKKKTGQLKIILQWGTRYSLAYSRRTNSAQEKQYKSRGQPSTYIVLVASNRYPRFFVCPKHQPTCLSCTSQLCTSINTTRTQRVVINFRFLMSRAAGCNHRYCSYVYTRLPRINVPDEGSEDRASRFQLSQCDRLASTNTIIYGMIVKEKRWPRSSFNGSHHYFGTVLYIYGHSSPASRRTAVRGNLLAFVIHQRDSRCCEIVCRNIAAKAGSGRACSVDSSTEREREILLHFSSTKSRVNQQHIIYYQSVYITVLLPFFNFCLLFMP
jgi:hypothetical protein